MRPSVPPYNPDPAEASGPRRRTLQRLPFLVAWLALLITTVGQGKERPPIIHRIPLPPQSDFSEIEWIVGDWKGKTGDKSPPGQVSLHVAYDLDKRFLVFRHEMALATSPPLTGTKETWLGILGPDRPGSGYILRVFSDTGFVTRYRVVVEAGTLSLNPEGGEQPPPGWLFRRTLQRVNIGEIRETVQIAPPQKPFFDFYTASLVRIPTTESPPPATSPSGNR